MTLQWTLVAVVLHAEVILVILMMLLCIPATMWQRFFRSRLIRSLAAYAYFSISVFFVFLLVLFLDSIREMTKYSSEKDQVKDRGHLDAELQVKVKMFKAQRNYYIAGFALFLPLVIWRIGSLLSNEAQLKANVEASVKQAQSASATAEKLIEEQNTWIEEKTKLLHATEERGNDLTRIMTFQRRLSGMERDLAAIQAKLDSLKQEAEKIEGDHPEEAETIRERVTQIKAVLEQLTQLTNLEQAEELAKKHETYLATMEVDDETINSGVAFAQRLCDEGNFEADKIHKKAENITERFQRLQTPLLERKAMLLTKKEAYQFRRDVEDEKLWISEKMPLIQSTDYGNTLLSVQMLKKKNQSLRTEIENHEPRIINICENGQKLINESHEDSEEFQRLIEDLLDRWSDLKRQLEAREDKLLESKKAQQKKLGEIQESKKDE